MIAVNGAFKRAAMRGRWLLLLVTALAASGVGCSAEETAVEDVAKVEDALNASTSPSPDLTHLLDQYVAAPDPAYSYTFAGSVSAAGVTLHFLNMNSLSWRDSSEVSPNVWNHWVTVIVPDQVLTDKAHLFIVGESISASPPAPEEAELFASIASATGTVAVVLSEVPGQPLQFADRPAPIREDALVAYSWRKMMETGDPTWAAYFPMTKASVRAMDTAESFLASLTGVTPSGFIVTGFSKRGATAWLTAAVDPRVEGVVPGVFNVLRMSRQIENQYENYGEYAVATQDYLNEGVLERLRSPEGRLLTSIVDPINYKARLTMPHYILQASGDQFFLPDASQLFVNDIPGEVTQRIVPNEDHSLSFALQANVLGLVSWYQSLLLAAPRPTLSEQLTAGGTLEITTDQPAALATLWQAHNPNLRDFRFETIGASWLPTALTPDADGVYRVAVAEPSSGYTAYLVEFTYPGAAGVPQLYTTNAYVTPDTRPFVLDQAITDPRRASYWRRQVRAAINGAPIDYTVAQIEAMLPIRVLGTYINDVTELSSYLAQPGGGAAARRKCAATRLNVESERLGWYSNIFGPYKLWQINQLADDSYAHGKPFLAQIACGLLNRQ